MKWISVKDKLPEVDLIKDRTYVISYFEDRDDTEESFNIAKYDKKGWYIITVPCFQYVIYVTHWMPLPKIPQKEK